MRPWLLGFVIAAISPGLFAEDFDQALEAGIGYDALSGSYDPWQSAYMQYEHALTAETLGYLRYNQSRRFDLSDNELLAGIYTDLSEQWLLFGEIGGSGTASVRPELQGQLVLSRVMEHGYLLSFGVHRNHWNLSKTQGYSIQLERYFGQWRWAYRIRQDYVLGGDHALGHAATVSYFYDDWSSVTFALNQGQEAEKVGPGRVLVTDVKGLSLYGLHQVASNWGIRWALSFNQQGDYYDRQGILLGLRYRF